jgi:hypothetical protein
VLTTGGGGEPADSGEVRIFARDVLTPGSAETLLKTVKGSGTISVDETRVGGDARITRIEIQNNGTAGDLRIEDFSWTSNPKFSPAAQPVDVFYRRASGGYASTTVTIGGKSYPCTVTADNAYGCVVKALPLYPYQNVSMSVANGSGTPETIVFNAGTATQPVYAFSGIPEAHVGAPGQSGQAAAVPNANEVMLFYKRNADDYSGWGVHLFPKDPAGADWTTGRRPAPGRRPGLRRISASAAAEQSPAYSNNPPSSATSGRARPSSEVTPRIRPGPADHDRAGRQHGVRRLGRDRRQFDAAVQHRQAGELRGPRVLKDTVLWKAPTGVTVTTVDLLYCGRVAHEQRGRRIRRQLLDHSPRYRHQPQIDYLKDLSAYPAYSPADSVANAPAIARSQVYVVGRDASGVMRT